MRRAGFDALIIEGKAAEPIFLVIHDDDVSLKPADHLVGKNVTEKTAIIRDELKDPKISVMCIGPAGEKLVKIATVMFEHRATGRCGAGAVMRSKNLLGMAVKGTQKAEVAHPNKLKEAIKMPWTSFAQARRLLDSGSTAQRGISDPTVQRVTGPKKLAFQFLGKRTRTI